MDHRSPSEFLRDLKLSMVYHLGYGPPMDNNPGVKISDLRIYPKALSKTEMEDLHEQSYWHSGEKKRQCVDVQKDRNYMDPTDKDESGNSCAWYAAQSKLFPEVCNSNTAKKLCPIACKGVRECHDGSWANSFKSMLKPRYRVFQRVMLLSPQEGVGLMCPAAGTSHDKDGLLFRCGSQSPLDEAVKRYWRGKGSQWQGANRIDPTNCTALKAALEAGQQQCEWDDSWMTSFRQDYQQTQSWSATFWMKATSRFVAFVV